MILRMCWTSGSRVNALSLTLKETVMTMTNDADLCARILSWIVGVYSFE